MLFLENREATVDQLVFDSKLLFTTDTSIAATQLQPQAVPAFPSLCHLNTEYFTSLSSRIL